MDENELKSLLQRNLKLSEENNKMLHSMRRSARWSTFFRLAYWIIILGGAAVAYSYVAPYLETVLQAYQDIQSLRGSETQQQNTSPDFSRLLEQFKR